MLCGEYPCHLDEGGRVCIPLSLRRALGDGPFIIAGCNDHLEVWREDEWKKGESQRERMRKRIMS